MATDDQISVLQDYPSAVLALRGALRDQRLGLMLGAGVSRAFDFGGGSSPPSWPALVARLEEALAYDASIKAYLKLSLTQRVDVLFREFLRDRGVDPTDNIAVTGVMGQWRDLIRDHLYADAPPPADLLSKHAYLAPMLDLVLKSPLTVTYNFDSFLEEALSEYSREGSTPGTNQGRPYETVLDATLPQRQQQAVVFHINGYLPRNPLETPSDQLVFSEADFSDQLVMTTAGRYATISHHLLNNVYLLLGLSLEDANLRHLLHTHARSSPGRIHFIVRFLDEPCRRADLSLLQQSIAESGFELHNLCTLYLTNEQIAALTQLISMPAYEFGEVAKSAEVGTRRVFYLSGVPGIGKTTVLRHMGGLMCLDEWMTEPDELLSHPFNELSPEQRGRLDGWVAKQFRSKNEFLLDTKDGIVVVERGPLDPLAFEERDRVQAKAASFADRVEVGLRPLAPGHVVVLHGDSRTVSRRVASRQSRPQAPDYLDQLQTHIRDLYGEGDGVSVWRSTDWPVEDLVKRVARLVYQEEYREADMQAMLASLVEQRVGVQPEAPH